MRKSRVDAGAHLANGCDVSDYGSMVRNSVLPLLPASLRQCLRRSVDSLYCRPIANKVCLGIADQWHVCLGTLSADSIVYSVGVGRGITFELALVKRIGCKIELFDPSPTAITTMMQPENQHPNIEFHKLGFSAAPGLAAFALPHDPAEGSFFIVDPESPMAALRFPVSDLATIMREHGNTHIDLLKMDIEGAEYDVIDQICREGISVSQLCVELHPHMSAKAKQRTKNSLTMLRKAGFRLVHKARMDHTFLQNMTR